MDEKLKKLKEELNSENEKEIEISTVDVEDDSQTEIEIEVANDEEEKKVEEPETIKVEAAEEAVAPKAEPKPKATKSTASKPRKKKSTSSSSTKALELEIQKQKDIAMEYQDKYQRLLAEFENARNRNEKESRRMYDVGAKEVLEKLLPVVDNFERALQAIPEEDLERAFEQGVDKIYKQLMVTLDEVGVKPMDAEGSEFNPDLHNAVMHVEDEAYEDNIVVEEMQKGYMYKDGVLRHSMVKVAN